MNTPPTTWPRENTASSMPSNFVSVRASTSQASVAPEKKVKPSPNSTETTAHQPNGALSCQSRTYRPVATARVTVPHRKEVRRPRESATTPVGISNSTMPAV